MIWHPCSLSSLADATGCCTNSVAANAPVHEKKMLQANMAALHKQQEIVRSCLTGITEGRASGARTADLEERLKTAAAQVENLGGIVGRQQTIATLWTEPTPAYARKAGEAKELEAHLTLMLGVS